MKQKLLIVDDEPGIVETMAAYFSAQYEILTARNGREAVKRAAERPVLTGWNAISCGSNSTWRP